MDPIEIHDAARRLFDAHGDAAELEAAQKARHFMDRGDTENAEDWKHIREAISQMRGSHVS